MKGMLLFFGGVKQDPAIDAWLKTQTPELGAIALKWFTRMRECGDDVRELMHDGYPTVCVEDAPFGYVAIFRAHTKSDSSMARSWKILRACWKETVSVCAM